MLFAVFCVVPAVGSTVALQLAIVASEPKVSQARTALIAIGVLSAVCVFGWLFFVSLLEWLALSLLGARPRFRTQVRVAALSLAPLAIGLVPYLCLLLLPFWCCVLRVAALRGLQGLTWGQVAFSVLGLPVGAIAVGIALRLDLYFW